MNYADNIFFLKMRLKAIRGGLKLDLDASLYARAVHAEVLFISSVSEQLYSRLRESSVIVDKLENLKAVQRLTADLIQLLTEILEQKPPFAAALSEHAAEYGELRDELVRRVDEVKKHMTGINEKAIENRYIISEDEYKSLLANEE